MDDFLGIAVVGALLSLAFEFLQKKFGIDSGGSKFAVIILSLAVGGVYWYVRETVFYESFLGILASASTVYALFFSGNKPMVL